jgi:HK97 family phage portal protein
MSVLTRVAAWLGIGSRAAGLDPFIAAAVTSRYVSYGTPPTPESAARKIAVGSSIRLITNTARTLPAHEFRGEGAQTEKLPSPMILRDPDGTGRGLSDWVAQAAWSLAGRGNLMVHILTRTGTGMPDTIQVLNPNLVQPEIDSDGTLWWRPASGPRIPGRDVIHRRMYPVPGAVLGLSPIEEHARTIGMGISAEKFGADFFDAGGHPTALLKSSSPLTQPQADNVKSKFRIAADSREPVLLPDGISYEQIQVKPEESQFLDAQGYSSAECARIFGPGMAEILGYETGGSMTYTNVVDRDIQLLKYTLDPVFVIIEDVLTACRPKTHYVKLSRGALLRTNQLDRYRGYEIASRIGMQTPNEQRALEDEPPVPWGNQPYTVKQAQQPTGADQQPQTGAPQ